MQLGISVDAEDEQMQKVGANAGVRIWAREAL
jgi:hypothetical protein